ncbi:hypothetical protein PTKIN_Ptkin01aG0392800 [Pterospermum kingtungense]
MAPPFSSLVFTVHRREPELVAPAKPTPREYKLLSDIDDHDGVRCQIPNIQFYRHDPSMQGKDPARVIREALARTLVFYYPLAGRIREGPNRKLMVDCTGEGVLFIEADADVTLDQFGDPLQPPFPCWKELLYDVPGSSGVLNRPLLHVQVTRLRCGGFIFAFRFNHTMCDAAGQSQFMSTVGEMARGRLAPSIPPVWERHLLAARDPPRVTCKHPAYDNAYDEIGETTVPYDDLRSFFFGHAQVSALRKLVPQHLRNSSTFELLTACFWRCRTIALQVNPDVEVRMVCTVNSRSKFNPPLPLGYYGNMFAHSAAVTQARKLCENPLGYANAIQLVKQAKADITEEYMKSLADFMVIKGRPHYSMVRAFLVSDVTRSGYRDANYGWGKAVYDGPTRVHVVSFHIPFKNKEGEDGTLITLALPAQAIEIFVKELDGMLKGSKPNDENGSKSVLSSP